MLRPAPVALALLLAALWACSSDEAGTDAGTVAPDALAAADAAPAADAAADDAAAAADDAAELDADPTFPDADPTFPDATAPDADPVLPDATPAEDAGPAAALSLTSPTITAGMLFPREHTCDGRDVQPQLDIANVPVGTQSLALVLIDDTIDYVHWIALDIPARTRQLTIAASDTMMLPAGTREIPAYGVQFQGPCPPARRGAHTYTFRLYALSVATTPYVWPRGRTYGDANLMAAFGANALGEARLTGAYER